MKNIEYHYKIGDFAKLCGTTIDTLLHYEDVGILKPAIIKANGWRYYLHIQFFTFLTISALKQSGCSLEEIYQYLNSSDLQSNKERLKERLAAIDKQIDGLHHAKKALQESIESINCAESQPIDSIRLITLPEENIIVESLTAPSETFEDDSVKNVEAIKKRLEDFSVLCKQMNFVQRVLPQLLFPEDKIKNGDYRSCYWFHPINKNDNKSINTRIKPDGMYASMIAQGRWPDSFSKAYQRIKKYLTDNQLSLRGDVYIYPLKTVCTSNYRLDIIYQLLTPVKYLNNKR